MPRVSYSELKKQVKEDLGADISTIPLKDLYKSTGGAVRGKRKRLDDGGGWFREGSVIEYKGNYVEL